MLIDLTMVRGARLNEDEIETEVTEVVTINPTYLRSFNPRRDGKVGTRLTFADGGGFAVTECYQEVRSAIIRASMPQRAANARTPDIPQIRQ